MRRVALVTGANTGIGRAIAQRLQRDGHAMAFHTRDDKRESRERFEEIAGGGEAQWVVGDLAADDVGKRLVSETVEAFGRIDALVNTAGTTLARPSPEYRPDDFVRLFAVHDRGAFLLPLHAA